MDKIKIDGEFSMKTYKIINNEKHLIESYTDKNLVVNMGRSVLCRLLGTASDNDKITKIAFGTNFITPTVSDTSLINPYVKNISSFGYDGLTKIIFDWELLATEANGLMVNEYGLFTFGNTLFARKVRTEIEKKIDIVLEGTWTIIFI